MRSGSGHRLILSDDFATDEAPDLKVALSRHAPRDATNSNAFRNALVLGELKHNRGGASFEIPGGTEFADYKSVVIYCEAYSILWTAAPLSTC